MPRLKTARSRPLRAFGRSFAMAGATLALLAGGIARGQFSTSPFTQPSATTEYLKSLRDRSKAGAARPTLFDDLPKAKTPAQGIPTVPGSPQGPVLPTYPTYPVPTPETGLPSSTSFGRTRYGLTAPTTAQEYSAYSIEDPLRGPSLFPGGIPGRPEAVAPEPLEVQFGADFDPFVQFQQSQTLNPYRNDEYQSGPSQGRFGRESVSLNFTPSFVNTGRNVRNNIQAGDLKIRVGFIAGLDYTDNALFSATTKSTDIIRRLGMRFAASYPVTDKNTFNFTIAGNYLEYLLNPEFNDIVRSAGLDLTINPGSRLSFESEIGNIFFTVFDSFSVSQRTEDDFLSQVDQNYPQFNNTIGIAADWLVNNATNLTGSINRTDRIALDKNFSDFDSTSYNLLGAITYSPRQTWTVGLQSAVATTDRSGVSQFDSSTFQFGPTFAAPLSLLTQINVGAGIQQGSFDVPPTAAPVDKDSFNDYYFTLGVTNRLNRYTTQTARFGHETGLADFSNFFAADYVRYNVAFDFTRTTITTFAYHERQENSGGTIEEKLQRLGGGINVRHQLNPKVTLLLGFNYGKTDSDVPGSTTTGGSLRDPNDPTRLLNLPGTDSTQQTFSFDIAYPFTKQIDLVLGYRRLMTESSAPSGNFTENRGSINFSYNF